jgi:uncharacterized protein
MNLMAILKESVMKSSQVAAFDKQNYLSLETFRKSGAGVPTPVWFAEQDGMLYVRTGNDSGKVKRIRNNSRVRLAPCNASGGLKGEWVEGRARILQDPAEIEAANHLLNRKYGLQKRFIDWLNERRGAAWSTIAAELVEA